MSYAAPSVSVILLCYDSEAFVRDAIESAFAQDYPGSMTRFFRRISRSRLGIQIPFAIRCPDYDKMVRLDL